VSSNKLVNVIDNLFLKCSQMFLHTEGNFLLNSDKKTEMYNLPTVSYLRGSEEII